MTTPDFTASTPLPELSLAAGKLCAAMEARRTSRIISRAEVNAAMMAAFPKLAGTADDRPTQWALLTELAEHQLIKLPAAARWDSGRPPLPDLVTFPATASKQRSPRRPRPAMWRPEIHDWAKDASLTSTQVDDLVAINDWLRDSSVDPDGRQPLPLQERSWLIFKSEKKLARLQSSAFFAPGRLTLDQLGTFRQPPPLAITHTGQGNTVLVIENSDTYASIVSIIRQRPGLVGVVAFGGGHAFEASVLNLCDLPDVERIFYYGDLDLDGLLIPIRASATASTNDLPPIEPAIGLYKLLFTHQGRPTISVTSDRAASVAAWLPQELRSEAEKLLIGGLRIPQEATNRLALSKDLSWLAEMHE
jgi:hypothetical protein